MDLGTSIQTLSEFFNADDGLVAAPESASLQGAFDTLTGLLDALTGPFDQLGLWTNRGKMVSMACRLWHTPHAWSTEAYTQKVTGRGISYRERLQQRVHCPE